MNSKKTATKRGLFSLLWVMAFSAYLQAGALPDSARIAWKDSTHITISIPLTASAAEVQRDARMNFFPTLTDGKGSSLDLAPVAFAGKRNIKIHKRSHLYDGYKNLKIYAPGEQVNYEVTLPVEPWMKGQRLELHLRSELENCCEIMSTDEQIWAWTRVLPWNPVITDDIKVLDYGKFMIPIENYLAFDPNLPLGGDPDGESIIFELDKSVINTSFRNNQEKLDNIIRMMEFVRKDTYLAVEKIRIIGSASPEGPWKRNVLLADARVKALKEYIQARVSIDNDKFEVISIPEAWADARAEIAASNRPEKEKLLAIIDQTEDVNKREALLRSFEGGKVFKELIRTTFADLRLSGRIKVYYSDQYRVLLKKATALYRQKDYQAAYNVLQPLKDDSRSFNLLGASAYMLGRKEEARTYFEKGARAGDSWAERNSKGMPVE